MITLEAGAVIEPLFPDFKFSFKPWEHLPICPHCAVSGKCHYKEAEQCPTT